MKTPIIDSPVGCPLKRTLESSFVGQTIVRINGEIIKPHVVDTPLIFRDGHSYLCTCGNTYKNILSFKSHSKSKKHLDAYAQIRRNRVS